MKRYKKPLRLLAIIVISILGINTLVLYRCFSISPADILYLFGNSKHRTTAYYPDSGLKKDVEALAEKINGVHAIGQTGGNPTGKITPGASCEGNTVARNSDGNTNKASSSLYMTEKELMSLYSIGLTDKLTVISILSKLGSAELNNIIEISKNGVTLEEYSEIESIAQRELSPADVETLRNIVDKYRMLYAQED